MKITGARVYDPVNSINGAVKDIFTNGSRIAARDTGNGKIIDASGCVAMAGAIDVHSHLLGISQLARLTGKKGLQRYASPQKLSKEYLAQGITFFVEAGLTRDQLMETASGDEKPDIEYAALQLACIKPGRDKADKDFLTFKYVGDTAVKNFLLSLNVKTSEPPPHVHLPHLAKGEGFFTLNKFLEKLGEKKCHLSHVSHYAIENSGGKLRSAAKKAAILLNMYKNVTLDLAPIAFGQATSFTVDEELLHRITRSGGGEPVSHPESPYAAAEYAFKKNRYLDSILWITGMEFFLYIEDLSRASLSMDFPSGGGIGSYPSVIACLMDKNKRDAVLNSLDPEAVAVSSLGSLEREYTLYDVATVTRASPAYACGFKDRGHLGEGAVADMVIYDVRDDIEKMFRVPRHVIKDGEMVYPVT